MSVPARIITVAVCLAAVSAAVAAWRVADDTSAQASTATDPIASREPRELETGLTRPPYSWQSAAEHALREPKRVRLPYAEQGTLLAHEVGARAFSFSVQAGQTIELNLARMPLLDGTSSNDRIHIDVWRVATQERSPERLEPEFVGAGAMRVWAAASGVYIVRLAPEPGVNVVYGLTLERTAALPFPVDGHGVTAVHSVFGDSRDAGTRRHEGVDIFASRSTPVLAVAEGRAVPRNNELGGRVVFLNTAAGLTYYYAHLERAAVSGPTRVRVGDVIGYVGNTGNASSTPPHLHFGIYRWGHGAIDPMPRLRAARFADRAAVFASLGARLSARDTASTARLHALPGGGVLWAHERGEAALPIAPRSAADDADTASRVIIAGASATPRLGAIAAWPDRPEAPMPVVLPSTAAW